MQGYVALESEEGRPCENYDMFSLLSLKPLYPLYIIHWGISITARREYQSRFRQRLFDARLTMPHPLNLGP